MPNPQDPFSQQADFTNDDSGVFNDNQLAVDPAKDYFVELVGEGKMYKDDRALARATAEKEAFIQRLKNEAKELREELKTRQTAEQIADRISQSRNQTQEPTPPNLQGQDGDDPVIKNALTPEDIEQIFEKKITDTEKARIRQSNYESVLSQLSEKFGDRASSVIRQRANELGVDLNTLKQMASDNPKLFLAAVVSTANTNPDPFSERVVDTKVDTSKMFQRGAVTAGKPQSYYNKLRQESPNKYFSTAVQVQMNKDALALGEDFYDT